MFLCFVSENVCHFISFTPRKCFDRNTCTCVSMPVELPEKKAEQELFVLKHLYRYEMFRDGQLEAIRSITDGNDTLALIPTGCGESVVYRLLFSCKGCLL